MEIVDFLIVKVNDNMCRIVPKNNLDIYKKISGNTCICSIDMLISNMEKIKKEIGELGKDIVFTV